MSNTVIHCSAGADRHKAIYDGLVADGFTPVSFNIDGLRAGQVPRTVIQFERAQEGAGIETVTLVMT